MCFSSCSLCLNVSLLLGMMLRNVRKYVSTGQSEWDQMPGNQQPVQATQCTWLVYPSNPSWCKGSEDDVGSFPRTCLLNWMPKKTIHECPVVVTLVHGPQVCRRTILTPLRLFRALNYTMGVKPSL